MSGQRIYLVAGPVRVLVVLVLEGLLLLAGHPLHVSLLLWESLAYGLLGLDGHHLVYYLVMEITLLCFLWLNNWNGS